MRKLRLLLILGVLTLSVTALSNPSYCFDCGAEAQHACTEQSIQDLNNCCQAFGCDSNWSINYCLNRADNVYYGCMVLKGCPNPAKPSM